MPNDKMECDRLLDELNFIGPGWKMLGQLLTLFHRRLTRLEEIGLSVKAKGIK